MAKRLSSLIVLILALWACTPEYKDYAQRRAMLDSVYQELTTPVFDKLQNFRELINEHAFEDSLAYTTSSKIEEFNEHWTEQNLLHVGIYAKFADSLKHEDEAQIKAQSLTNVLIVPCYANLKEPMYGRSWHKLENMNYEWNFSWEYLLDADTVIEDVAIREYEKPTWFNDYFDDNLEDYQYRLKAVVSALNRIDYIAFAKPRVCILPETNPEGNTFNEGFVISNVGLYDLKTMKLVADLEVYATNSDKITILYEQDKKGGKKEVFGGDQVYSNLIHQLSDKTKAAIVRELGNKAKLGEAKIPNSVRVIHRTE